MILNQDEKDTLKSWLSHPWRNIAERYDEEQIKEITSYLMANVDFSKTDEATLKTLRDNQIAMNSVKKYFASLKSLTNTVVTPK